MERLTRREAADELREEAASYRRLAKRARTTGGSSALIKVAGQFDDVARCIGPKFRSAEQAGEHMTEREKVEQAELDRYGIQRIPADVYLWGGYRYSNARDALAAAKRNAK